jgi:hypothetical protein
MWGQIVQRSRKHRSRVQLRFLQQRLPFNHGLFWKTLLYRTCEMTLLPYKQEENNGALYA